MIDLWEGPGHAYYTGPLVSHLARRADVQVGILINQHQDRSRYQGPIDFFPINAPSQASLKQLRQLLMQPVELARAAAACRSFQPDLAHLVFPHPWFTALAPLLARWRPWTATWHDIIPHPGEKTLRNKLAVGAMLRHASAIFVHGKTLLDEATQLYPSAKSRLYCIAHGHFDNSQAAPGEISGSQPPTFLCFGRQLPYKGLGLALTALEKVLQEHPSVRLIIAGAGSLDDYQPQLKRLSASVEILNRRIQDEELPSLMRRPLAALLPYTHASGSGVVASLAAHSVPVIASRLGGLKDMVVDGETGFLVETGNVAALARAMIQAVENPQAMRAMGRRSREWMLREGSWETISSVLVDAYQKVIEGRP